jgi:DNA-binding GntR family transcriptional regulator
MKRYQRLASQIGDLIKRGDLPPGTRIPAIRAACDGYGVSPSTVFRAYYSLETQGLIVARPRSGYFVSAAAPDAPLHGAASTPNEPSKSVNISELVFEVLHSIKDTHYRGTRLGIHESHGLSESTSWKVVRIGQSFD